MSPMNIVTIDVLRVGSETSITMGRACYFDFDHIRDFNTKCSLTPSLFWQ